jgi:glycosyltransferase involved in cell wall biosynthesis
LVGAAKRAPRDLIYERHALHCRAGLLAARRLDLPFFLEVNSPLVDEMRDLGLLRFPKLARRTEREVLGAADRVFVVTRVLGEIVERLGARGDRIVVTPNGADLAAFAGARQRAAESRAELVARLGGAKDAVLLGFIGFPRPWHRLDLAIDALAELLPRQPGLQLVVVGEGPALPELRRRAEARGVGDRLHATGAVPRQAVPPLVAALDVALIPAMNAYASPLKLYDSLAAGVPTLAPDQPNLRETVIDGQHAFLFAPDDAAAFRDRLRWILDHRSEAERVARAGAAHLRELDLTWDANARRVVAEWRRVAS